MLVLADNFLAGALITLLIPATTFVVITLWYTYSVTRLAAQRRGEKVPEVPGPPQPEASGLTATGQDPPMAGTT